MGEESEAGDGREGQSGKGASDGKGLQGTGSREGEGEQRRLTRRQGVVRTRSLKGEGTAGVEWLGRERR